MSTLHVITAALSVIALAMTSRVQGEQSRAAWWLAQDGVRPVADLRNESRAGRTARFVDQLGKLAVTQQDDALVIRGVFRPNIWRIDYTTFDGQFDMKRLYIPGYEPVDPDPDSLWSAEFRRRFGEEYTFATGPWDIYGEWRLPTARVSLDGKHVYTNWFDLPSPEDQAAERVYASFALDIREPGEHEIRIAFAPFTYNTRAHRAKRSTDAEVKVVPNSLKPDQIASIAVGVDERTRAVRRIRLRPQLVGKHPRMSGEYEPAQPNELLPPDHPEVQAFIIHLDPERGQNWEYSLSEESMASDNDMDLGRKLGAAARTYDELVPHLTPEAKAAVDEMFVKRADGFYTFCVFQRNYHPTGYAQNHASAAQAGLVLAGLAFDGPIAQKWLDWAVALYSKRVELLGTDGSVEFMNEGRRYGLRFWQSAVDVLKQVAGIDLAQGPFFENEWRFALHHSPSFDGYLYAEHPVPIPTEVTPDTLPTDWHFADADQVFMRSDWSDQAYRVRFWCGPPFGHHATNEAKRYNFSHYQINQGSVTLARGGHEIIHEPNATRDYRKSATGANCIVINGTDQWGGGHVWHPKLSTDQYGHIAVFADGELMSVARGDLKNAYPPGARLEACSRIVVHLKPDHFLVYDQLQTDGPAEAEWRYHAGYIETTDSPSRFTCVGHDWNRRAKPPEKTVTRAPKAAAQVSYLYPPDARATLGHTEMYYRWPPGRPTLHMGLRQSADDGQLRLLTALGPEVDFRSGDNAGQSFRCVRDGRTWTVLVGPGQLDGLESDARFTVAAYDAETRRADIFRWGGRSLAFRGTEIKRGAQDLFVVLVNGKVRRTVTSIASAR